MARSLPSEYTFYTHGPLKEGERCSKFSAWLRDSQGPLQRQRRLLFDERDRNTREALAVRLEKLELCDVEHRERTDYENNVKLLTRTYLDGCLPPDHATYWDEMKKLIDKTTDSGLTRRARLSQLNTREDELRDEIEKLEKEYKDITHKIKATLHGAQDSDYYFVVGLAADTETPTDVDGNPKQMVTAKLDMSDLCGNPFTFLAANVHHKTALAVFNEWQYLHNVEIWPEQVWRRVITLLALEQPAANMLALDLMLQYTVQNGCVIDMGWSKEEEEEKEEDDEEEKSEEKDE